MKLSVLLCLGGLLLLGGCNTQESDSTNDARTNNFTILKGSVPGTLIEAFCEDGSYYRTNSVQNGTSRHPFELKIPKQKSCHLVMTTNENDLQNYIVTHIGFVQTGEKSSVFQTYADEIDLGYIDLPLERENISDINNDGVLEELYSIDIEEGIEVLLLEDDPLDSDGDGILNVYEDYDEDGISNYYDPDYDNPYYFEEDDEYTARRR